MKKIVLVFLALAACCFNKAFSQIVIPEVPAELQETVIGYIQILRQDPTDETVVKAIDKNKLLKNDKNALIAIGYKFLENNFFGNAINLAKKVYSMDATFLPAIYLEGDAYFKINNNYAYDLAATKYEEAKSKGGENIDNYVKLVEVYCHIKPQYATELLQTMKEKYINDPKVLQAETLLNSLTVKDTQDGVSKVEEPSSIEEASIDEDFFVTPDLNLYRVHGHVKKIVVINFEEEYLEGEHDFTYNGELVGEMAGKIDDDDWNPYGYERDKQMRIAKTGNDMYSFKWDGNNLVSFHYGNMGELYNTEFIYDNYHNVIGYVEEGMIADATTLQEKPYKITIKYTDIEMDSHHNIISYKVLKIGEPQIYKREIIYW